MYDLCMLPELGSGAVGPLARGPVGPASSDLVPWAHGPVGPWAGSALPSRIWCHGPNPKKFSAPAASCFVSRIW